MHNTPRTELGRGEAGLRAGETTRARPLAQSQTTVTLGGGGCDQRRALLGVRSSCSVSWSLWLLYTCTQCNPYYVLKLVIFLYLKGGLPNKVEGDLLLSGKKWMVSIHEISIPRLLPPPSLMPTPLSRAWGPRQSERPQRCSHGPWLLRTLRAVFYHGFTIYIPTKVVGRFPFLYIFCSIYSL